MKQTNIIKKGNIVKTYYLGKTIVHINDACAARTKEEIDRVLDDMHRAGWVIIEALVAAGEEV